MTSAFDTLSENYWQQFCQDVPVGGGMAYQNRLKECNLDLSKDSLQRVDGLLSAIKKELLSKNYQEDELLKQSSFRNFIFFVAFYAARVIAANAAPLSWRLIKDNHAIQAKDKFYAIAAAYDGSERALLILMTVGARLFASFDRPFYHPDSQVLMEDSLYWLADDYLKQFKNAPMSPVDGANQQQTAQTIKNPSQNESWLNDGNSPIVAVYTSDEPTTTNDISHSNLDHINAKATDESQSTNPALQRAQNDAAKLDNNGVAQNTTAVPSPTTLATPRNHQIHKKTAKPAVDFFAEAKLDLDNLPAVNHTNQADFDKAYRYICTLDNDALSEKQKANRLAAVKLMAKTAQAGNTSAMIALGMYYFGGVGVKQDEQKGFAIIQKAADLNDVRAQKLLSRLYYQGYGVQSNIQMGELWLRRAADNGHTEASKIVAQMNYSKLLQDDFRVESQKEKRYFVMMIMAAVAGVLLFWLTGKVLG